MQMFGLPQILMSVFAGLRETGFVFLQTIAHPTLAGFNLGAEFFYIRHAGGVRAFHIRIHRILVLAAGAAEMFLIVVHALQHLIVIAHGMRAMFHAVFTAWPAHAHAFAMPHALRSDG